MFDPETILVMGASGTIGGPLVAALVADGQNVRAAHRTRPVDVAGVVSVRIDAVTGEGLDDALGGVASLFLLVGDMPDQTNAELRVLEAARRAGVTHIVKLSTWGAQSEAFSIARIHRPVELAIERSGRRLRAIADRPHPRLHSRARLPGRRDLAATRHPARCPDDTRGPYVRVSC